MTGPLVRLWELAAPSASPPFAVSVRRRRGSGRPELGPQFAQVSEDLGLAERVSERPEGSCAALSPPPLPLSHLFLLHPPIMASGLHYPVIKQLKELCRTVTS